MNDEITTEEIEPLTARDFIVLAVVGLTILLAFEIVMISVIRIIYLLLGFGEPFANADPLANILVAVVSLATAVLLIFCPFYNWSY